MKSQTLYRGLLILGTFVGSWLWMQALHELGHVLTALAAGGAIVRVDLPVLGFSRTDVSPNPQPLLTAWGGPVLGAVLPLMLWALLAGLRVRAVYLSRFFAGFCLVANGVYLLIGAFDPGGDPGDILRFGSPAWHLITFGSITLPLGFILWHREGRNFGLGKDALPVPPSHALGLAAAVTLWITAAVLIKRL
jgi:hypothetical protein